MKKSILIGILILIGGFTFGQTLKKGNLVGTHVLTIELNPGVTMKQFQDFHLNTLIPEYEKHYPGWQLYLAKGIRGENKNMYAMPSSACFMQNAGVLLPFTLKLGCTLQCS